MMIDIREISLDDADAFLQLCLCLDDETPYMMFEPGERKTTITQQRQMIADVIASSNSTILVAVAGDVLAGYVAAQGGEFNRIRHTAYVVAGVREAFSGQGIGGRLFVALEGWAVRHRIQRLELTVRTDNDAAIRLYQRHGFDIEGTKRQSLIVGDQLVDEYYMARLLPLSPRHR